MYANFQLKDSQFEFNQKIMAALAKEANKHLKKLPKKLEKPFREIVADAFRGTDIFDSLLNGSLRGRFGFPYATENIFVGSVLLAIKEDLHVEFEEVWSTSASLMGGLNIYVVKKTLEDILKANGAEFQVNLEPASVKPSYPNLLENEPVTSFNIPWVQWLLLEGDKILVSDFAFVYGDGKGRSNKGVMRKTDNSSKWFKIPKEFSGTINDNWITRTLDHYVSSFEVQWSALIEKELN